MRVGRRWEGGQTTLLHRGDPVGALDAASDAMDEVDVLEELPGGLLWATTAAAREHARLWGR